MTRKKFFEEYQHVQNFTDALCWRIEQDGLEILDKELDWEKVKKREPFCYGLSLILYEFSAEDIDKILSNIAAQEKDGYAKTLILIKKEAVLGIMAGKKPRVLRALLNSYIDQSIEPSVEAEVLKD